MEKKYILIGLVVLVVLAGAYMFFTRSANAPTVSEGAPSSGTFSYINSSKDLIAVESPKPGEAVGQAFSISGTARGYWFFEGSFPVEVQDGNGTVLSVAVAQAEGDWMTEAFVPFKAQVSLSAPYTGQAILVLKKDNPSGEPQNEASVSFPVIIQN